MITGQKTLGLSDPRRVYQAPVMTVETVRGILGKDEDEVAELIDDGKLTAWDIGSEGAERRELRISTESAARLVSGGELLEPREAIMMVLPGEGEFITGRELARALVCSGALITRHLENGDLALVPGSKNARGNGGTPKITRASVGAFLRGRMEGGYVE